MKRDQALIEGAQALRSGNASTALRLASQVAQRDPEALEAWWLLGHAAAASGDMALAASAFAQGYDRAPAGSAGRDRFRIERIRPLVHEGRMAEAVTAIRDAVAIGLTEHRHILLAVSTLTHAGLPSEARALALRACAAMPSDPEAWYALGMIEEYLGSRDEARQAFERAIAVSGAPFPAASYRLAHSRRWSASENHLQYLKSLPAADTEDAARVAFALFKECDDIGDTAQAWEWLQRGAAIQHRLERWSRIEAQATVDAWLRHFPREAFACMPRMGARAGPRRIFVLGLPRSGTTLVERILAAHPTVHAMGEPKAFAIAVRRLVGACASPLIDAEVVGRAAGLDPKRLAAFYTRETALFDGGLSVTIDKRTQNVGYVGLIRRAFPDAAIVHLERDPMDNLFGCYKRLFAGSHNWSYRLEDLADHYVQHRRLIDHFGSIPEIGLIRVRLEDLIAAPEPQIRLLLRFCGLTFDEACLRPHEAPGPVMTASSSQVRDPINRQGVGAWLRYEEQLEPLRASLSVRGFLDSA